jgi:hypothetical protein
MTLSVTAGAECNQIFRHIPAKLAPGPKVMNLQVLRGTEVLASPTASFRHPVSDHDVFFRREFEPGLLLA